MKGGGNSFGDGINEKSNKLSLSMAQHYKKLINSCCARKINVLREHRVTRDHVRVENPVENWKSLLWLIRVECWTKHLTGSNFSNIYKIFRWRLKSHLIWKFGNQIENGIESLGGGHSEDNLRSNGSNHLPGTNNVSETKKYFLEWHFANFFRMSFSLSLTVSPRRHWMLPSFNFFFMF